MVSPTTDRRLGLAGGTAMKAPAALATTANIVLSGEQVIDGTLTNASRVLVKNQTNTTQNGLYDTSTGSWTRCIDANGNYDLVKGTLVLVTGGAVNIGLFYAITSASPLTIDTSSIVWTLSLTASVALLSFLQAGTGAVLRTAQDKMRESGSSVTDFGGVTTVDCAAAVTLASAAAREVYFPPGTWPAATTPTITGNSLLRAAAGAVLSGAGMAALGFTTGATEQRLQENTTGTDFATSYFRRNASHAGGSAGFVSSCVRAETWVSNAAATNYEWALVSVLQNSATAGQNVAGYLQGNKNATGPTWALVAEAIDSTNVANPTKGLLGAEIDIRANGTDSSNNRVGVDVVITRQLSGGVPAGVAMQAGFGVRVQNSGDGANSVVTTAFGVTANAVVGFDTSAAVVSQAAYKMGSGQSIAFDAAASNQVSYDGTGIAYKVGGTVFSRLNADGSMLINPAGSALKIFGTSASGASTPTLSANKPGANAGVTTWLSVTLNGTQLWIPAFGN